MIDCEHPCACNCVAEANAALTAAGAERDAMSNVIGRMLGSRFLDPPDGGDVPLPEQVRRVCEALLKAEAELAKWRQVRDAVAELRGYGPEWPEHGNAPLAVTSGYALTIKRLANARAAAQREVAEFCEAKHDWPAKWIAAALRGENDAFRNFIDKEPVSHD